MRKLFWRLVCALLGHLDPAPPWYSRVAVMNGHFCPACERWVEK